MGFIESVTQFFLFLKIYFTAHICCMWTHNKYRAWVISCFVRIRWRQANFPSKNTIVKSALLKVFDLYLLRYFWGSWPISWEPWFSTSSESESQRDMTVALQCLKDAVCWLIRLPLIHRWLSRRQRPHSDKPEPSDPHRQRSGSYPTDIHKCLSATRRDAVSHNALLFAHRG